MLVSCVGDRPTFANHSPSGKEDAQVEPGPSGGAPDAHVVGDDVSTGETNDSSAGHELGDDGGGTGDQRSASDSAAQAAPDAEQPLELGAECDDSANCASGHCVDGVCCDTECAGQCQSCTEAGNAGHCLTVSGSPPEPKEECLGEGVCKGTCDGVHEECTYASDQTTCSDATCATSTGVQLTGASCDGAGFCAEQKMVECGSYACDGAACRPDCAHDGHCRNEARCADGVCVEYQSKRVLITPNMWSPGGGITSADAYCNDQLGNEESAWKALLTGGGRVATVTPFAGDGQADWVLQPFTEYYNWEGRLMWATDDVALLGVRDGVRVELDAPAWDVSSPSTVYPWSGYADDWKTVPDETCNGWLSTDSTAYGAFAFDDLTYANTEPCAWGLPLMCVEQ